MNNLGANDLVKILIKDSLYQSIKEYGLEGTEQKIKELYSCLPKCRDLMLEEFHNILAS